MYRKTELAHESWLQGLFWIDFLMFNIFSFHCWLPLCYPSFLEPMGAICILKRFPYLWAYECLNKIASNILIPSLVCISMVILHHGIFYRNECFSAFALPGTGSRYWVQKMRWSEPISSCKLHCSVRKEASWIKKLNRLIYTVVLKQHKNICEGDSWSPREMTVISSMCQWKHQNQNDYFWYKQLSFQSLSGKSFVEIGTYRKMYKKSKESLQIEKKDKNWIFSKDLFFIICSLFF